MGDAYDAMEATDVKAYERREMERRIDERASRLHSPILQHFDTCVTLVDEDEAEHQALFEQNVAMRLKIDEARELARHGGIRISREPRLTDDNRLETKLHEASETLRKLVIILSDEP
jgi:hypothetical protein